MRYKELRMEMKSWGEEPSHLYPLNEGLWLLAAGRRYRNQTAARVLIIRWPAVAVQPNIDP